MKPSQFTFYSILSACSDLVVVEQGKQIHSQIIKLGSDANVFVESALGDMYEKCGIIEEALKGFDKMQNQTTVSWTVLIIGYAHNGFSGDALQIFRKMLLRGMKLDNITFIGVLSACNHSGLVHQRSRSYRNISAKYLMKESPKSLIISTLKHYVCAEALWTNYNTK